MSLTSYVNTSDQWQALLRYYRKCLEIERALLYSIKQDEFWGKAWLLNEKDQFIAGNTDAYSISLSNKSEAKRIQQFAGVGQAGAYKRPLIYTDSLYIDERGYVMPILYIAVRPSAIKDGISIVREVASLEVNIATILAYQEGEQFQTATDRFYSRIETMGTADSVAKRNLLIEQLTKAVGVPPSTINHLKLGSELPSHSVINSAALIQIDDRYTMRLLRELQRLESGWEHCSPSLRALLSHCTSYEYPEPLTPERDPRLYLVTANTQQRKAVAAAGECPITIITGPPGTGKSQLILNIIGDSILKGESVLFASRNNEAVQVVFDRFLDRAEYRGAVRSGKEDFRKQIAGQMRNALDRIQRGEMTSNLIDLQAQHSALQEEIKAKTEIVEEIERAGTEVELFKIEKRRLSGQIPGSIMTDLDSEYIPTLEEEEGQRLLMDARLLLERILSAQEAFKRIVDHTLSVFIPAEPSGLLQLIKTNEEKGIFPEFFRGLPARFKDWQELIDYFQVWEITLNVLEVNLLIADQEQAYTTLRSKSSDILSQLSRDIQQQIADTEVGEIPDDAPFKAIQEKLQTLTMDLAAIAIQLDNCLNNLYLYDQLSAIDQPNFPHLFKGLSDPKRALVAITTLSRTLIAFHIRKEQVHLTGTCDKLSQELQRRRNKHHERIRTISDQLSVTRDKLPLSLLNQINHIADADTLRPNALTDLPILLDRVCKFSQHKAGLLDNVLCRLVRGWPQRQLLKDLGKFREHYPFLFAEGMPLTQLGIHSTLEEWRIAVEHTLNFAHACALTIDQNKVESEFKIYTEQAEHQISLIENSLEDLDQQLEQILITSPTSIKQVIQLVDENYPESESASNTSTLESAIEGLNDIARKITGYTHEIQAVIVDARAWLPSIFSIRIKMLGEIDCTDIAELINLAETCATTISFYKAKAEESQKRDEMESLKSQREQMLKQVNPPLLAKALTQSNLAATPDLTKPLHAHISSLKVLLQPELDKQHLLLADFDHFSHQGQSRDALQLLLRQRQKRQTFLQALYPSHVTLSTLSETLQLWALTLPVWRVISQLRVAEVELKQLGDANIARNNLNKIIERKHELAAQTLNAKWDAAASSLTKNQLQLFQKFVEILEEYTKASPELRSKYVKLVEEQFYASLPLFPVWAVTNLSTQFLPLSPQLFDCVIIDEASQCDIPSALPLLFRAKRIIIIGDNKQLAHIANIPDHTNIRSLQQHAVDSHYSYRTKSLFQLGMDSTSSKPGRILLKEHFRSHPHIIGFSNNHFYDRQLVIKTRLDKLPDWYRMSGTGAYWINIDGVGQRVKGSIFNLQEQDAVITFVKRLYARLQSDPLLKDLEIGIVTPFRKQKQEIENRLKTSAHSLINHVEVGTVHTYQGNERDIMIFSMVASSELSPGTLGFLTQQPNLLNVALTRARSSLYVFGNHDFISRGQLPFLSEFAQYVTNLDRVYATVDELPIFSISNIDHRVAELDAGIVVRPDTPEIGTLTLDFLLQTTRDYLWWIDPYMTKETFQALIAALIKSELPPTDIRLLTLEQQFARDKRFTLDDMRESQVKLAPLGVSIEVRLAKSLQDISHDRFVLTQKRAYNVPPMATLADSAPRLTEFRRSAVKAEDFLTYWSRAIQIEPD